MRARYLNLAGNYIESLPDAITRLWNLQTLYLDDCENLKELPRDFDKLVNLRYLEIDMFNLIHLPPGFGKMTSLQKLKEFIVGKGENTDIDSLPALNLRGALKINFCKWHIDAMMEAERANLKNNHQLISLSLDLRFEDSEFKAASGDMERMLTCLHLPQNLQKLKVYYYKGDGLPHRWLDRLSKIVLIDIRRCQNCRVLPHFSQLPHLQVLTLRALESIEYIDHDDGIWGGWGGESKSAIHKYKYYFPSLEMLELVDLPQLKGWTRSSVPEAEYAVQQRQMNITHHHHQYQSSRLFFPINFQMKIHGCPKLKSMLPLAPRTMKSLKVGGIHRELLKSHIMSCEEAPLSSSSSSQASSTDARSLRELEIWNMDDELISLSVPSSWCNQENFVMIWRKQLRSLMFETQNSIHELDIRYCNSWKNISAGLQNLHVLENLNITSCQELDLWDNNHTRDQEEEEKLMTAWQSMTSLRSLVLSDMWKLKRLPRGIACLTTLQSLSISFLNNLIALPEEVGTSPSFVSCKL